MKDRGESDDRIFTGDRSRDHRYESDPGCEPYWVSGFHVLPGYSGHAGTGGGSKDLHIFECKRRCHAALWVPLQDDLDVYKLLLNVSGIGPKGGLGILSAMTADDLRFAVLSEDAKSIAKAPGIGAKTAQKLILELKDKLSLEDAFEKKLENTAAASVKAGLDDAKSEAVQALVALGYSNSDALKSVRKAEITSDMDTETILKLALKQMAFL